MHNLARLSSMSLVSIVRRFPLPVFAAFMAFLFASRSFQDALSIHPDDENRFLLIVSSIGAFFWFGAVALMVEARRWSSLRHGFIAVAGFSVIAFFLFWGATIPLQGAILGAAIFLILMAAPFVGERAQYDELSFWSFNKMLGNAAVIAFFTALVLFAGLCALTMGIEYLFGIKGKGWFLEGNSFPFCALLFAPVYALYWIPAVSGAVRANFDKACDILVTYIQVPLTFVYLLILYAYAGKIFLAQDLPEGGLTFLAAGFSALGLATWMEAWPIRESGKIWVRFFWRHFFKFMPLPLVLMAVAVGHRIADYGVTDDRYYGVLATLWLGGVALTYLWRPTTPMKYIPLSLAVALFISLVGPWSATNVSTRSQLAHLEVLMQRNNLVTDGKIVPAANPDDVPVWDRQQITSIMEFLFKNKRGQFLPYGLARQQEKQSPYLATQHATETLGFKHVSYDQAKKMSVPDYVPVFIIQSKKHDYRHNAEGPSALDIAGYSYFFNGEHAVSFRRDVALTLPASSVTVSVSLRDGVLMLRVGGQETLLFDLNNVVRDNLAKTYSEDQRISVEDILLEESGVSIKARLIVKEIAGRGVGDKAQVENVSFYVLLGSP